MASVSHSELRFDFRQPGEHERAAKYVARQTALESLKHGSSRFTRDQHVVVAIERSNGVLATLKRVEKGKSTIRELRAALLPHIKGEVYKLRKSSTKLAVKNYEFKETDWKAIQDRLAEEHERLAPNSPHYKALLAQELERTLAQKFGIPNPERAAHFAYQIAMADQFSQRHNSPGSSKERTRDVQKAFPGYVLDSTGYSHPLRFKQLRDARNAFCEHLLDAVGFTHAFSYMRFRDQVRSGIQHELGYST